jgi:hypothetical protein
MAWHIDCGVLIFLFTFLERRRNLWTAVKPEWNGGFTGADLRT